LKLWPVGVVRYVGVVGTDEAQLEFSDGGGLCFAGCRLRGKTKKKALKVLVISGIEIDFLLERWVM